jgi:hypothetical protein
MDWVSILTLLGGGLILSGVAYPAYAQAKGWPIGSAADSAIWSVWFFMGGLAYLAGMFSLWGWLGLIAAIPAAFVLGLALTSIIKRHIQLAAYGGPLLANIWYII